MKIINGIKFALGLGITALLRLAQIAPNVEPILGATFPIGKRMGRWTAALFSALAIVSFDLISNRIGFWTVYTALAYGAVGYAAGRFFENRPSRWAMKYRLGFAVASTVAYDGLTAAAFGWQFGQPLAVTIAGQLPFTAYHLLGNALAVTVLAPLLDQVLFENPALEKARHATLLEQPIAIPLKVKNRK